MISHALDCKRGGLVNARYNDLCDGVADLAGKAFTPSHVRNDPPIYSGRAVKRNKAMPAGASGKKDQAGAPPPEVTEQKGNLLIRNLWQNGTDSFYDMCVVNTDAKSHMTKDPEKCLQEAERGKKYYTWRHASRSAGNSPPLLLQWMDCWGWRRRQPLRGKPFAWPPSGSNPN